MGAGTRAPIFQDLRDLAGFQAIGKGGAPVCPKLEAETRIQTQIVWQRISHLMVEAWQGVFEMRSN